METRYSKNGFYVKEQGESYLVGLSLKGQDDVGDVLFASFEKTEGELKKGQIILGVEGAKAVSDLTAPLSGQIVSVHLEIEETPDLLNSTADEDNWVVQLKDVDREEFQALPSEMDPIEGD